MKLSQRWRSAVSAFRGAKSIPNIYGTFYQQSYGGWTDTSDKSNLLAANLSWVYACVNIRAKSVAQTRFRIYRRLGADEFEEIEDHPLFMLLSDFNPFWTKYELLYTTVTHLDLTGDAYWYIARDGMKRPREIWPLQADKMSIIPDPANYIKGYELKNQNQTTFFRPEEVVHFRYPKSNDPYYGWGPLSAAAASHDIDHYQLEYSKNLYINGAIPPIALSTEKPLGDISRRALADSWHERFGGPENQGKIPVLDNGLKIQPVGVNPKDLDWLASNRTTRDQIMGIFGVPASKLGLVEDVNRASAEANDYTFAVNVVEPILNMVDDKLTKEFAREFPGDRLIIKHDTTIPKDEEKRARIMKMRLDIGLTTRNEERLMDGYEAVEGGDDIYIPVNYQQLGATPQVQETPQPQGENQ